MVPADPFRYGIRNRMIASLHFPIHLVIDVGAEIFTGGNKSGSKLNALAKIGTSHLCPTKGFISRETKFAEPRLPFAFVEQFLLAQGQKFFVFINSCPNFSNSLLFFEKNGQPPAGQNFAAPRLSGKLN
jgi:hypothetical protein